VIHLDFKDYIEKNYKEILALLIAFTIGGIFGFIYEELFYYVDLGYIVKRGTTMGPWIPIYGFGSVAIIILTQKLNKNPVLVFGVSCLVTGAIEYITGFLLYHILDTRLWDYNTEIWNWGNIGGYICLRSILFFGISALLLDYIIYPSIIKILNRSDSMSAYAVYVVPFLIFALDILVNSTKLFRK
jgi:uncharacterized membrane protein